MSIQLLNDTELVQLYISGKEESLAVLLERHKTKIFTSIICVTKDRELANDVFQETFFKVIQTLKRGQYNEEGKFLPWVLRIARNLIIDHYRALKKMPPAPVYVNEEGEEITAFHSISSEETADMLVQQDEKTKYNVRALIQKLPLDQREVVLMRTYYDMSFKEIAEFSGVSINTALGRMRYALLNLKKMIEEQNIAITS
ncbi:MAG: sigma-70 family RNA polymerase sigma factor [Sphingobacteriaceae bacterium]|nr:sigma-70 family RNA polymerase sigma factor [Sphingobacteriaceae bacterium]